MWSLYFKLHIGTQQPTIFFPFCTGYMHFLKSACITLRLVCFLCALRKIRLLLPSWGSIISHTLAKCWHSSYRTGESSNQSFLNGLYLTFGNTSAQPTPQLLLPLTAQTKHWKKLFIHSCKNIHMLECLLFFTLFFIVLVQIYRCCSSCNINSMKLPIAATKVHSRGKH